MRFLRLFSVAVSLLLPRAEAQSEMCQEAYESRDQIREKMNESAPNWTALHYKAKQQTQQCDLLASLWHLREQLALKVGDTKDAELSRERRQGKFVMRDAEFEALLASRPKSFNPATPVGNYWALVAGTGQFKQKGKALEFAVRDLQAMKDTLRAWSYPDAQVLTAIGKEFTKASLTKQIATLREQVAEDDLVMVYVLSHGMEGAEDTNSTSILLTSETDASTPQRRYETGIQTIALVQEIFRELKARRVIVILDACFSGDGITGHRAAPGQLSPRFLDLLTQNSGRVVISASMADQRSFELREQSMGAFAYCWTTAAKQQGSTTILDLFSATEACVAREVSKFPERVEQRPAIFASERAKRIALAPNK
jgi:hypothetical protein